MRLYTHTHTSVLENRKKEEQEEVENINFVDNLWKEKSNKKDSTAELIDYVNNTAKVKNNNKEDKKDNESEKKIKSKEGKLREVSCLLVLRKITAIVILIIIVLAILVCFGTKYNWKIENIIEKISKVINIKGTSAEIEEVAAMDMTKVELVPDKNNVNVPVPKGYVLSGASDENDVTKGAVIYEGTTAVTDSNVATQKTTRNQFVWVPVSAAKVGRIYGEDVYGRKFGKLYDYNESGRETRTNGFEPYLYSTEEEIDRDEVEYEEKFFQQYNLYGYTQNKLYEEMQKNYEQTIESIKIYGGFYIGRYETGNISQRKPVCVQYNEDITGQSWYTMYNKAQYLGANANVKSMMIYGSLWDEVLMWLYESGSKKYAEIGDDSSNWGNYCETFFQYYATAEATSSTTLEDWKLLPTGARAGSSSDGWKRNCANNIYDLAGNAFDMTQEASEYDDRTCRGGWCQAYGFQYQVDSLSWDRPTNEGEFEFNGYRFFLIIL